jgi:hypothetical protein
VSCITIKGKKFTHQSVYDGPGSGVHCIFCQKRWSTKEGALKEVERHTENSNEEKMKHLSDVEFVNQNGRGK